MAPSQPIWKNPVEEAALELEKYLGTAGNLEKFFLRYYSKDKVDTKEFENTDLNKYYHLKLEQTPREAGQFWMQRLSMMCHEDPCVQTLCEYRIPLEYYKDKGSKGPLVTSRGEMEENHIKLWIEKLEKKFYGTKRGTRKLNYDRVIRDYYELSVILKRCLTEASVTLKCKTLGNLVRRVNAVDVFLLREVCIAYARHGHNSASIKDRKALYDMTVFILAAELMFKRLRLAVIENIPKRRESIAGNVLNDGKEGLYSYAIEGGFAITSNPTLVTSEAPSSSSQKTDDVVTYYH